MKRFCSVVLPFFLFTCLLTCLNTIPAAFALGVIAVDETNFPDPYFRSYISEYCDKDGDGYLNEGEIAAVEELSPPGGDYQNTGKIKSLQGIEYFTNIVKLDCSFNQLTSLNISNNTKLKTLYCYYNQLEQLNIESNTELLYLICGGNPLKNLNLRNNKKLSSLECFENQLTELDLTENTELDWLVCSNNQLQELNINLNTALSHVNCSSNEIKNLDLTNNRELHQLICFDNRISALILSSNVELYDLECYFNQIGILDISPCNELVDIASNTKPTSFLNSNIVFYDTGDFNRCLKYDNSVKLVTGAEDPNGIAMTIGSYYDARPGDTIEIPLKISGMDDLVMVQFALAYDQTSLEYLGFRNGALLEDQIEPTVNGTIPGKIYYVWDSTKPVASYGEMAVFEFKLKSKAKKVASVCVDTTEEIFFADSGYNELHPTFVSGHIVIFDFCLPVSLMTIEEKAFEGSGVTFVRLADDVKSIGPRAFANCSNLNYIIIPADVTIDPTSFDDVTGLTIIGVSGSSAESFAKNKGFSFVTIDQ